MHNVVDFTVLYNNEYSIGRQLANGVLRAFMHAHKCADLFLVLREYVFTVHLEVDEFTSRGYVMFSLFLLFSVYAAGII